MSSELFSSAILSVIDERVRQINIEGYDEAHDDQHGDASLARAAETYIEHYLNFHWICTEHPDRPDQYKSERATGVDGWWPWNLEHFKPKSPRQDLIRATALLIAEIERLDRKAERDTSDQVADVNHYPGDLSAEG